MQGLYKVGQRVRLRDGVDGPECRIGTVIEVDFVREGYMVKHDRKAGTLAWLESELCPVVIWPAKVGRILKRALSAVVSASGS